LQSPPKTKRHATGYAMMWRRMTAGSSLAQNIGFVNGIGSYLGIMFIDKTNDLLAS
jgi:hypothetical protein